DATLSELRFTSSGYRFILGLKPGYQLGALKITGVTGPGRYVITYDAGSKGYVASYDGASTDFKASVATAADPAVVSLNVPEQAQLQSPIDFSARLANSGT